MAKIVGLIFAAIAAFLWMRVRLAAQKTALSKVQSLPVGVKRPTLIMIVAFSIFGPAILIYGMRELAIEIQHAYAWLPATGTVTHLEEAGVHKGRAQYRAAFTFKDQNGLLHSALSADRLTSPPNPGSEVAIHYNPNNATEANLYDPPRHFGMSTLLSLLGAIILTFAIMAGREVLRLNALKSLSTPNPHKPIRHIEGHLLKSKKNIFLSLKNNSCWQLHVEHHDQAGRRFTAISEPIWERNPESWVNADIAVPLVVDSTAPEKAWVQVHEYFKRCQHLGPQ